jgi:cysteine desulfurase/selenocysteine lyase
MPSGATDQTTAIWTQYRDQFPVCEHLVYLNHAAGAPLCRAAAEAIKHHVDDNLFYGSIHYAEWSAAQEGLRAATARMIGAKPTEIALVKNTTEGVIMVAQGFDWRPGDKVVAFNEEFPANYHPWKLLEHKGVRVEWLSEFDSLDKIDAAARGARMLAISFVQYLSGYRVDLDAIGEICKRHGCFLFVDAIQGLGAFPLDVSRSNIAALSADGYKWLLGPEGCAVLYIRPDLQERVQPIEFGYKNVTRYTDYGTRNFTLRDDAARYECGTLNTPGCYGLRASMEFLLNVGIDRIASAVAALGDRIDAGVRAKGYQTMRPRTPQNAAGIVSFRKEGVDTAALFAQLRAQNFATATRSGWLRASPHFYISPEEIDRFIAALP